MDFLQNQSLKTYNSFGIEVKAKYFAPFNSAAQLSGLLDNAALLKLPEIILGGGTNILLTKDVNGCVLKNNLEGISITAEDEKHIFVKAAAGEIWHSLVLFCLKYNYAGMENLSLIPGNVGASPMQNIGAYGVELKDVFHELDAWDKEDKKVVKFNGQDCEFGYRESVFKKRFKNRFVILNVTFKLNRHSNVNTSYGAIQQELERMQVDQPTIQNVSQAVINIRSSKLPDPKETGNAGSFFKNPVISATQFRELKATHPGMPGYVLNDEEIKVAAGWLIESCGWKGFRQGDAGCHAKQALVLVNHGSATGEEILNLAIKIEESVLQKFGINLEKEVNII